MLRTYLSGSICDRSWGDVVIQTKGRSNIAAPSISSACCDILTRGRGRSRKYMAISLNSFQFSYRTETAVLTRTRRGPFRNPTSGALGSPSSLS